MKNVRDKNQVTHLGRQFAPGKATQFIDAFKDATSTERGYTGCPRSMYQKLIAHKF